MSDRATRTADGLRPSTPDVSDPRPQGGLQEGSDPSAPKSGEAPATPPPRELVPGQPPDACLAPAERQFLSATFPFSGFLIIRLVADQALAEDAWLAELLCSRLDLETPTKRRGESEDEGSELTDLRCLAALVAATPPTRLVLRLPPIQLLELERHAAGQALPPIHSLATYWRLDARRLSGPEANRLAALLESFPAVDIVYREIAALDPESKFLRASQGYLTGAPVGIGARRAVRRAAGEAAEITLIDLEQGWLKSHEDLQPPSDLIYGSNRDGVGDYRGNHGTAVLGELVANGQIEGSVPGAPALRTSHYHAENNRFGQPPDTSGHVADAVVAAVLASSVEPGAADQLITGTIDRLTAQQLQPGGDVLLIEVQRGGAPTEIDAADFDAIRLACSLGLVVVEAAGNGSLDLDRLRSVAGERSLGRGRDDFGDSGATLVGASRSALPHDRAPFSNFGSRVDCYAWGENVVTAGYGDLDDGDGDPAKSYTNFSGTSSAAPIIAGAAAVLQARSVALGNRLTSTELRRRLADPATGTHQGPGVAGSIGVMPDLGRLVSALGLEPRAYLRDRLGDRGEASALPRRAESPDVLVLSEQPTNAQGQLQDDALSSSAAALTAAGQPGAPTFVYTRLRNPARGIARQVTTTIYASEPAPLVPPESWNLLGTTAPIDVPQGDLPQVAGPVQSTGTRLPAVYLAVTDGPDLAGSPPPDLGQFCDFEEYLDFLALHTRRQIVEVSRRAESTELPFSLAGAFDRPREFGFTVEQRLPEGVEVRLEGPRDLLQVLASRRPAAKRLEIAGDLAALPFPAVADLSLGPIALPVGESKRFALAFAASFRLKDPANRLRRGHRLTLTQRCRGIEVGRLTWRFAVSPPSLPA